MRVATNDARVKFYIGDVRDRASVDAAMRWDFRASCRGTEAGAVVRILPDAGGGDQRGGSHNVVESAIAHRVARLVCLSTDKAVYPVNAMGMDQGDHGKGHPGGGAAVVRRRTAVERQ